jgi:hypothetical protein
MKAQTACVSIGIVLALHMSTARVYPLEPDPPTVTATSTGRASGSENEQFLLTQFLTDDRNDAERDIKTRRRGSDTDGLRTTPLFIIGLSGALSNQEGFAMVSAMATLGIQYDKLYITTDPVFIYSRTKSMKMKIPVLRKKSSGEVLEFGLPVKCTYAFLDLSSYRFSPYVQAGIGYDFRKFNSSGSSLISRAQYSYYVDSLTLHYGIGFIIKTTEQTRFQVGLNGTSYFNANKGEFSYDTTGASLLFGMIVIFD